MDPKHAKEKINTEKKHLSSLTRIAVNLLLNHLYEKG